MRDTPMRYTVATDEKNRTASEVRVESIPHAMVISSDGIVRWQGHPEKLSAATLDRIVRASQGRGARGPCERWKPH